MEALTTKGLRDLRRQLGSNLAIAAVVAAGVSLLVMNLTMLGVLSESRQAYYDRYRFADVFASVNRAPEHVAEAIAAIPGVAKVQTRVVVDVTVDVPDLEEPAAARLISLPVSGEPTLNAVFLRSGRMPARFRDDEAVVSEAFVEANSLALGDGIEAVVNGRLQTFRIVGVGLSPEYTFQVRPGDLLPDDRRFGIFWVGREGLEASLDMDSAFNDVSVQVLRGASIEAVQAEVDRVLEPYGGIGAYDRSEQISARFLNDEIRQLRASGLIVPVIFMGVAAFLLSVGLARRIRTEREVIAMLKAFGYGRVAIAWHYLLAALTVSIGGAVVGSVAGSWMAHGLSALYAEFYRFPQSLYRLDWRVIFAAIGISGCVAVAAALRSVISAARLPPAEAMRPAAPAVFRRGLLEPLGVLGWLSPATRMIVRQLRRRPGQAFWSVAGIASAAAILVVGNFAIDAMQYLVRFQFELAQRQDVQVVFENPLSPSATASLKQLPGVWEVEPFRAVPVKMVRGHRQQQTSILGLERTDRLFRLLDRKERSVTLPIDGLVLNDMLAELLDVDVGQTVQVRVQEGKRPVVELPVQRVTREFAGTNAYMDRAALHRVLQETDTVSGAYLSVSPLKQARLYRALKETPRVAGVAIKGLTIESFRATIQENQAILQAFNIFFACVIALGVVYNTSKIALDERAQELATLRVIGFTRWEVSFILLGELALLVLVAIPIGWLMGWGFCWAFVEGFKSELFRIPLVVRPATYVWAAVVTVISAVMSGLLVRRQLDKIDLVATLKVRQ